MSDFKCPYCREWHSWDDGPYEEDTYDFECASCEKKFKVSVTHSIDYHAFGSCEMNAEMPHQLRLSYDFGPGKTKEYRCMKCNQEFYDWMFPDGKHPKLKEGEFFIDTQKSLDFL